MDKALLDAGKKLLFVGRVGSGMEIVDTLYAAEKGVAVLSSPEGNRNAVAEHALGMLLALANNLNRSNTEVKNFIWQREKNRGFELMGKTIGIVGFGNTGKAFSRKLMGMGMRILTYDILMDSEQSVMGNKEWVMDNMSGQDLTDENWNISTLEAVDFQTIKDEADIISFHLPLTAETKHMANADFFQNCQKNIILLNTCRGKVVNTVDLIAALESGKVKGACLDVFENEPALAKGLSELSNVIITPHIASATEGTRDKMSEMVAQDIIDFLKGETPTNLVKEA